jgi:hypothetical protein
VRSRRLPIVVIVTVLVVLGAVAGPSIARRVVHGRDAKDKTAPMTLEED